MAEGALRQGEDFAETQFPQVQENVPHIADAHKTGEQLTESGSDKERSRNEQPAGIDLFPRTLKSPGQSRQAELQTNFGHGGNQRRQNIEDERCFAG